jgi:hypothetical protein
MIYESESGGGLTTAFYWLSAVAWEGNRVVLGQEAKRFVLGQEA